MYKDVLSKGPDVLGLCKDVGRVNAPGEDSVDARFISYDQADMFTIYAEWYQNSQNFNRNFPINIQEYKHVNYTWNGLQGAEEQIFVSETIWKIWDKAKQI